MIFVTGASGLLGANFCLFLHGLGLEITALYHRNRIVLPGVTSTQVDLTDFWAVRDVITTGKPNWIVHCAALTDVDWCESHPQETYLVNAYASKELARIAKDIGARFLHVSTDAVFDGRQGAYQEGDVARPLNVYAASKLAAEELVERQMQGSLIIRTNIYGWNLQKKLSLAEWALSRLEASQPISGFRDVTISPILANDLGATILEMMEAGLEGIYHVAGGQACTKYDFAVKVAAIFELDSSLISPATIEEASLRAQRPRDISLSTLKVSAALDRPMPDVETGLRRFRDLRESGFLKELRDCE